MTTHHNNNSRTGLNTFESILVANNFPSNFGATPATVTGIDSMVYAQPLYVSQVAWKGSSNCPAGNINMVYLATENNTVYAIQADSPFKVCGSATMNSGDTAIPVTALPGGPCDNLTGSSSNGTVGITGTPVIDPASGTLFAVSSHRSGTAGNYSYTQRLNAVDITSLAIKNTLDLFTSVNAATPTNYPAFYVQNESQRAGLTATTTQSGINIFIPWGTYCDANITINGVAYGSFGLMSKAQWSSGAGFTGTPANFYVEGTNTNLTKITGVGSGHPAGIWMSGGAPVADAGGNIYFAAGNGNFEGVTTPLNFGNSIVKLSGSTLTEEDFYTPNAWTVLDSGSKNAISCSPSTGGNCSVTLGSGDWDLGSGGVVLLTHRPQRSTASWSLPEKKECSM